MIKFFWGAPRNTGDMRFHTGTLLSKPHAQPVRTQKHYSKHEIIGLYGVQIGKSFVGRIALGQWGFEYSAWAEKQEGAE